MVQKIVLASASLLVLLGALLSPAYAQSDDLAILDSSDYVDAVGFLHVAGEVQNNKASTVSYVEISGTFYDADGKVVATGFTYAEILVLRPGEKSAFDLILTDTDQIEKVQTYRLSTSSMSDSSLPANLRLSVGDSYIDQAGTFHQTGEVTNTGTSTATFVDVSAAFYNGDDIVATAFTYTDPSDIAPGQSAPFDVAIMAPGVENIKSASVNVQSEQYSMINEDLSPQTEETAPPANSPQENETGETIPQLFTEISGKYVSSEGGYEIEFPQGWSGVDFIGMAMVRPGGIDTTSESTGPLMLVMALDRKAIEEFATSTQDVLPEQAEEQDAAASCETESYSYLKINGVDAVNIVMECSSDDEYAKTNLYGVINDEKFIMIGFVADSATAYEQNVAKFDRSIGTLKVSNAASLKGALAEMLGLKTETHQVVAKENKVDLKVESNSQVSDFGFDEGSKRVSFRVQGADGTSGLTAVTVDKVLEGPYSVTIDGERTTDFAVVKDKINGENTVQISYKHSAHDIEITGTNVVPEFPVAMIGGIAAVIGAVALIGRTKFKGI